MQNCFDQQSVCFIFSYRLDGKQDTKLNNIYSSNTNIRYGAPHGSILDPLLFNIDIRDLFLLDCKCDIASSADDSSPYTSDISLNIVLEKLESSTHDLFGWFKENHIKASPDKCNLLMTINALTSVNINGIK